MSIKIMSEVWDNLSIAGSELLLLLAMADYANDEGALWPSIDSLSKKIRLKRRQTIMLLDKLEKEGYFSRTRRWNESGDQASNLYHINVEVVHCSAPPPKITQPKLLEVVHSSAPGSASQNTTPQKKNHKNNGNGVHWSAPGSASQNTTGVHSSALNPSINLTTTAADSDLKAVVVENENSEKISANLDALHAAGIMGKTAEKLARIKDVTPEYISLHAAQAKKDDVNIKILITRLRDGDPAPAPKQKEIYEMTEEERYEYARQGYYRGISSKFDEEHGWIESEEEEESE